MKKILSLALAALFCTAAMAQLRVTGTVTSSDDGAPVSFATVVVKGNNSLITSTDIDGKFVLANVPGNAVLVVSYIGFTTLETPVNNRSVVNIEISPDALALEEVMVVAYGTVKKASYTGAASVVKSDAIKDNPVTSFENAMNGKVAGMVVTSNSGQTGSAVDIRIRGIGSMNASNDPLYVVDGVPVISGSTGQMGGALYSTNNVMSTINPSDIESITILKDAAASSLYGSRAANGVIVIQTKRGQSGKPHISFKTAVGITPSFATRNYDQASP
ncbi:MAG: TonB-dependent receptor plug domain-containing protein, partial [Prevotellaceae bacterium]|nr:TonB-dependent receptor plug domain-containing protein [Prevotellaceae bacterium]